MAWSTITATLNYSGQPNVSTTIVTSDYPDAQSAAQLIVKNGGFWSNSAVGGPLNTFYPATAILYLTVS
jgi:hypothetical protein